MRIVKNSISRTVLLVLVSAVMPQAQRTFRPEDGFISSTRYTNAFFGFSLPFPQDAQLKPVVQNALARNTFQHLLFAANGTGKGLPLIVVGAEKLGGPGDADPIKTEFGVHKVDIVQTSGKTFFRSRWEEADRTFRIMYGMPMRGYVLFISTFSYDQRVLDEFDRSIQALTLFDPTKAREYAGPDAQPYEGPPQAVSR
jgi:hypothetical protein